MRDSAAAGRRLILLARSLRRFEKPSAVGALASAGSTIFALAAVVVSMLWLDRVKPGLGLLLAPLSGLLLIRIFAIQHDCGHRSFFSSRRANDFLGDLLGVLTLTPYRHWRKSHALHHRGVGHLGRRGDGDIYTLTTREFNSSSASSRFLYRVYRNPLVLFLLGPAYLLFVRYRLPFRYFNSRPDWITTQLNNLVLAIVWISVARSLGAEVFARTLIPTWAVFGVVGVWLFFIQHQFEDTYWRTGKDWNPKDAALAGSSNLYLPRALGWFLLGANAHSVHHLNSKIPCYRLQECLNASEVLRGSSSLGMREALRAHRLKLWDEDQQKLVSFKHATTSRRPTEIKNPPRLSQSFSASEPSEVCQRL